MNQTEIKVFVDEGKKHLPLNGKLQSAYFNMKSQFLEVERDGRNVNFAYTTPW
jgi:hypothetical protein